MRKALKILVLSATMVLGLMPDAIANISMTKLSAGPSGYLGVPTTVQLSLKSQTRIQVAAFLRNSFNETINGELTSVPRNGKTGTWVITFRLAVNARSGPYKLHVIANGGKNRFVNSQKVISFRAPGNGPQATGLNLPEPQSSTGATSSQSDQINQFSSITMNHIKLFPSFTRGLKPTCVTGKDCPSLSNQDSLLPLTECKIADATYPDDNSNGYLSSGFPPAKFSLAGQESIELLWIPVNFRDRKIDSTMYERAVKTAKDAENFYSYNSFGRVKFNFEVLGSGSWVDLPQNYSYYEKLWANRSTDITQFLLDNVGNNSELKPDAVMWLFPNGKYLLPSKPFNGREKIFTLGKTEVPAARVYGLHEQIESIGTEGFTHGVGHALYSFEDLYVFSGYSNSGQNEKPASYWDLMGGGGEFFSWTKWVAGWLKDSEVHCAGRIAQTQVLELVPFQNPDGKKMIVVPLNGSKVVLAEYRTNMPETYLEKYGVCQLGGVTQCESRYPHSGLLVYSLDTRIKHGAAPFRVAQMSGEPLLLTGQSLNFEGIKFSVLAASENSIFVQVASSF
jgi:hypothetical protein